MIAAMHPDFAVRRTSRRSLMECAGRTLIISACSCARWCTQSFPATVWPVSPSRH